MTPLESWTPSIKRLRLALLVLLPLLSGGAVHAQDATNSVIDVAVFYTPAAKNARGGTAQMKAKIDDLVVATNMAYADSGVNQTINLVAAEEVAYSETADINDDLVRLSRKSDGYLDEVHTIRDQSHADIILLLRSRFDSDGTTGIAYVMNTVGANHARLAFGVSIVDARTFAHELGHIMGLAHDRYVACNSTGCRGRSRIYAYGYVNQEAFKSGAPVSKRWRTIMAYPYQCEDAGFSCRGRPLRFSNPNQRYPGTNGDPLGVAGTRITIDPDGPADAARTLNENRDTVVDFRQGRAVKVSFDTGPYAVTEGGTVTVTVRLDVAPGRPLAIPLAATSTDGAWPGDYTLPASVTFSATETEQTFTFSAVQDTRQEDAETVTLGFGTPLPNGVTPGSQATATVTLTDASDPVPGAPSVDAIALTSDPGTAYAAGEEIAVAVVFTKPVSVTGAPQLGLTVGMTTQQMAYQADRSGSEVVVFTYTVVADEIDTDGVSLAANSLTLNGGTIQAKADGTQAASRTHVAVEAHSAHPVDGDTPGLVTAVVDGNTVTLTYDEALDETSIPWTNAFTVTVGGATRLIASVRVSGAVVTLTLISEVVHSDSVTLAYSSPAGTPPLQDVAGNPVATLPGQTVTNTTPEPIYDTDDDGLIAITTLAQLDAIRHDPDGNGSPTPAGATAYAAAFPTVTRVVCGASSGGRCAGYELTVDLDFDTDGDGQIDADDAYWNDGAGWEPIGVSASAFRTTFEGNGYTISHLFVNRSTTSFVGLFSYTGSPSDIRHVGLLDVAVTGKNLVGGLVGLSIGTIEGSYASGRVSGTSSVGGLVGWNLSGGIHASYATGRVAGTSKVGGLVGENLGRSITASYATGRVAGTSKVGGLVGRVQSGEIHASYATGRVTGNNDVGGLVGHMERGEIHASYATGRVSGSSSSVGGLVGTNAGTVTASYWDTRTSGQTSSAEGTGKTTTELQTPTDDSGIYADWDDAEWHFGTSRQYPVLKANVDGQGAATWQEFGYQLRAGPTLTVRADTGLVVLSWTAVTSHWTPPPDVTYTIYRDASSTPIEEDLPDTEYTDRDVTRDTTYTYQVAAVVNGGEATRSGLVEAAAPNQPPAFPSTEDGMRSVAENTPANRNIGNPVQATDPDDSSLTYSLGGTDAASFTITESTGQLRTKDALNHEDQSTYDVTVTVRNDKDEDATIDVTITVTDVNEPPVVSGPASVPAYTENSTHAVATYTATDPENRTIRWSVSDPSAFAITPGGVLTFRSPPDYEVKRSYTVTVTATDPGGESASVAVTISIVNQDEAGMVSLTGTPAQVGRQLTATLSDSDGGLSTITWQWERSATSTGPWTEITTGVSSSGARSSYRPGADDANQYLRVTAAYTDRLAPNQQRPGGPSQRGAGRAGGEA